VALITSITAASVPFSEYQRVPRLVLACRTITVRAGLPSQLGQQPQPALGIAAVAAKLRGTAVVTGRPSRHHPHQGLGARQWAPPHRPCPCLDPSGRSPTAGSRRAAQQPHFSAATYSPIVTLTSSRSHCAPRRTWPQLRGPSGSATRSSTGTSFWLSCSIPHPTLQVLLCIRIAHGDPPLARFDRPRCRLSPVRFAAAAPRAIAPQLSKTSLPAQAPGGKPISSQRPPPALA